MSLTAVQQELRQHGIGASEIAAALGLDPYRSPFDLYAEKTGMVEPFAGNEFTRWGDLLEPLLVTAYAEQHKTAVRHNQETWQHPIHGWMFCTPDALVLDAHRGLEVKNRNVRGSHLWGEAFTDQVPETVALQCHWSMAVTGWPEWDVAVLLGGYDFRTYRLYADPEIADSIIEMGKEFWFGHVVPRVHPPTVPADSERLGRLLRQSTDLLRPATDEIESMLDQLLGVRSEIAKLEQVKDGLQAAIKAFIADAAGIESSLAKCTWKTSRPSKKVDWEIVGGILLERLRQADVNQAAQLLADSTREIPGSRRFLISPRQEA
jgi:putative phage-type endonuclease